MQREIKFRGFSKDTMDYLYSDTCGLPNFFGYIGRGDWLVQQWTGLFDRNGKEIYEGDFIKYENPTDEQCVSRNTKNVVLVRWTKEREDNHPGFRIVDLWGQYGEMEVIGNIFENPELLKQ